MNTYTLTLKANRSAVDTFLDAGVTINIARRFVHQYPSREKRPNVLWFAAQPSKNLTFSWTDDYANYSLFAAETSIRHGAIISRSQLDTKDNAQPKRLYNFEHYFSNPIKTSDLESNEFKFHNLANRSLTFGISQTINVNNIPKTSNVYTVARRLLAQSTFTLQPTNDFIVWISDDVQGAILSLHSYTVAEIQFTNKSRQKTYVFNNDTMRYEDSGASDGSGSINIEPPIDLPFPDEIEINKKEISDIMKKPWLSSSGDQGKMFDFETYEAYKAALKQ